MIYEERIADLFTVGDDYTLAHCISADFALGAGIAVQMNKHYDMKDRLRTMYPNYMKEWNKKRKSYDCIYLQGVLNLVTKTRCFEKPTYDSLRGALTEAQKVCAAYKIKKLAMPKIGCGLDRLEWDLVRRIIKDVFYDTDIEIVVCSLK